jgi:hypothetical protein
MRGVVGLGLLPGLAPGLSWSTEIGGDLVRATGGALWLPEAKTDDGAFAFGLTAGWLGACVEQVRAPPFAVAGCGSALAGAIHAVVYAIEPTFPGDRPWAALALSERLRVELSPPIVLELGVDLIAPLTRHRFLVAGDPTPVLVEPPLAVTWSTGVGVSIP